MHRRAEHAWESAARSAWSTSADLTQASPFARLLGGWGGRACHITKGSAQCAASRPLPATGSGYLRTRTRCMAVTRPPLSEICKRGSTPDPGTPSCTRPAHQLSPSAAAPRMAPPSPSTWKAYEGGGCSPRALAVIGCVSTPKARQPATVSASMLAMVSSGRNDGSKASADQNSGAFGSVSARSRPEPAVTRAARRALDGTSSTV